MLKLKRKYQSEETKNELSKIVKELVNLYDEEEIKVYARYNIVKEYTNLLLSHLMDKTKLKSFLNEMKVSPSSIKSVNIIKNLKKDSLFGIDDFLNYLQNDLDLIKEQELDDYKFLFSINYINTEELDSLIEDNPFINDFQDILQLFNLYYLNKEDYLLEDDSEDVSDGKKHISEFLDIIFQDKLKLLFLESSIEARDYKYAFENVIQRIESFLGFLSFISRYAYTHKSYYSRQSKSGEDLKIVKLVPEIFMVTLNKDRLIHPFYQVFDGKEKILVEDIWDTSVKNAIKKLQLYSPENLGNFHPIIFNECIDILTNENINKSLNKTLFNAFSLYYQACSEDRLDYSFLKFWMVSELIIKLGGMKTDENVRNIMTKQIKFTLKLPTSKFSYGIIGILQKKRNDLVHKGLTENISQYDRSLSKLIADSILRNFIESFQIIDNAQEFDFFLERKYSSYDDLERSSLILNHLKTVDDNLLVFILSIFKKNYFSMEFSHLKQIFIEKDIDHDVLDKLIGEGWIWRSENEVRPTKKLLKYKFNVK